MANQKVSTTEIPILPESQPDPRAGQKRPSTPPDVDAGTTSKTPAEKPNKDDKSSIDSNDCGCS